MTDRQSANQCTTGYRALVSSDDEEWRGLKIEIEKQAGRTYNSRGGTEVEAWELVSKEIVAAVFPCVLPGA